MDTFNEVQGLRRECEITDNILVWHIYGGMPIGGLIELPYSPVYVEIGANDGMTCKWFTRNYPAAHCYCFEPDPRNIKKFLTHAYPPSIWLYQVAVSNFDGTAMLNQSTTDKEYMKLHGVKEHTDSSSILGVSKFQEVSGIPWIRFMKPISVKVIKLDTWQRAKKLSHIDFLWIDAEGCTGMIIEGATKALEITHYIQLEYTTKDAYDEKTPGYEDILNLLPNWEVIEKDPHNMLLHNTLWKERKVQS